MFKVCVCWRLSSWWHAGPWEGLAFTCSSSGFPTGVKGKGFSMDCKTLEVLSPLLEGLFLSSDCLLIQLILTTMPSSLVLVTWPFHYPKTEWIKTRAVIYFGSQFCNLTRGQWRRLIAAVHGISERGSTKGWRSSFRDYTFTWLLAVCWSLSLSPSSCGLPRGLSFLTAW